MIEVEDYHVDVNFLLQSIQELPDRYRLVFNLYALDGYSHKEIAKMLKITTGTTKSNLARARMILKSKIVNYYANLNFEPVFKYQLNTFNNTSGDFKPYFIGLYTGLSFKL